jgi:hypothetical protein
MNSDSDEGQRPSFDIATSQPDILDHVARFVLSYWRWAAFVLVGIVCLYCQWCWLDDPPCRIITWTHSLPDHTEYHCFAVERDGEVELLRWHDHDAIMGRRAGPLFLMDRSEHPANSGCGLYDGMPVRWRSGDRYGVVIWKWVEEPRPGRRGKWHVAWFDKKVDPNTFLSRWLLQKREVVFHLKGCEWLPLDAGDVKRLELEQAESRWSEATP